MEIVEDDVRMSKKQNNCRGTAVIVEKIVKCLFLLH